jgi:hypothetical protein
MSHSLLVEEIYWTDTGEDAEADPEVSLRVYILELQNMEKTQR